MCRISCTRRKKRNTKPKKKTFCPRRVVRLDDITYDYPTVWVCKTCATFLLSEEAVTNHLKNCSVQSRQSRQAPPKNKNTPNIICKYCNEVFPRGVKLKKHLKVHEESSNSLDSELSVEDRTLKIENASDDNHRVYPSSSNKLKATSFPKHKLKRESRKEKNEKILHLTNEVASLKQKLEEANLHIAKLEGVAGMKNLDIALSIRVGQQEDIKPKGNVSKNTKSNLEIPSYRVKTHSDWNPAENTEDMSDDIFKKRHYKHELHEKKCKRWDLQRMKELLRLERLNKGRNKHHSQQSNDKNKKELTTELPSLSDIKTIQITNQLPVSAFGFNLYDETRKAKRTTTNYKYC